tara:strand:- start:111 stop:251 length:141 start_codon:yes stop_codon:yes gene_type:complete
MSSMILCNDLRIAGEGLEIKEVVVGPPGVVKGRRMSSFVVVAEEIN